MGTGKAFSGAMSKSGRGLRLDSERVATFERRL